MRSLFWFGSVVASLLAGSIGTAADPPRPDSTPVPVLVADPAQVMLDGPQARLRLLVNAQSPNAALEDATLTLQFRSENPTIAQVDASGVILAVSDGETAVIAEREYSASQSRVRATVRVPVTVRHSKQERQFHFGNDILPIFGRHGCAGAGCHGKAEGQNGFKLSVFGFDPAADYAALLKESRGRRLLPSAPERSLLLTKASGQVPHGGGARIPADSESYRTLRDWIAAGTPFGSADAPTLRTLTLEPGERVMRFHARQALRVMATDSTGRKIDVTHQARFQSNNDAVAVVSADGTIQTQAVPGDAVMMAAFLNEVAWIRVIVPRPGAVPESAFRPAVNFIDPLVDARLRRLNLAPSGPVDDATFLRRLSLDLIGLPPTPDEVRQFLADPSPQKRNRKIESLLNRPEFADLWAMRLADLLRVDRAALGHARAYAYHRWIRDSVRQNLPLDALARAILTAEGPLGEPGPTHFYKVVTKPGERASSLMQVLLGMRVGCAECHHHPFDRWGQDDYHGLAAFFAPVTTANLGDVEAVLVQGAATAKHPRTGAAIDPTALGGTPNPVPAMTDPRPILADWVTSPTNPYFARNWANRVWAHLLGRGLVEPVDDHRATNPPTNPELLAALERYLIDSKFDLRAMVRVIVQSRTYQTGTEPTDSNARDEQNYSRALLKRLEAEVLADTLSRVLEVEERYPGMPAGTRAVQVWDSKVASDFLKLFGRPTRTGVCTCERVTEPTVAQVLHLLNSPRLQERLSHPQGSVSRLVRQHSEDAALADALMLQFLARLPTETERAAIVGHLRRASTTTGTTSGKSSRQQAAEDIAWGLVNTLEFVLNH
ncbi:DUF1549 and DUF1553 domain-containing protein [Tuwongella immobilis]|uniref:BIG2 domain-containing protein n=1 Tax=Tuwongella immobilis TaxID=692036 RepID=A0A6C2YSU5_9BACT|nr:DUF1549 and DUF1553 domain-containing protein [Tuwongella immobilis]VIP04015.1 Ig-like domain-containing protein OS=Singulisphaera acidiphila (strain ATCC BAA-1392 / DSM 18658 / VKM B-2454 / MOB10) GN=Sinac_3078 PE=4 SV=1: PSCyt2: PSD1 [Tuwongella immobilis]VTS05397.1 Ig-like domain-containing protein OS=Singulisphaera acidiphila (strain ATCC BAA-1392 / DSM 18658 / VKM B-2454 / MOB10) GN=Sinac_3078 PE=4 SV=1: PSCyt2: PSD1 [Tuwongella immobilis]